VNLSSKFRTIFRGDLAISDLPRELLRRRRAAARRDNERRELSQIASRPARLSPAFEKLDTPDLVRHFREREVSLFESAGERQQELFPDETRSVIAAADEIVNAKSWELAGFGALTFDAENRWRCDPLTGTDWGLDYHADVVTYQSGGPDIRVLWELNRFGHALTLAGAFSVTGEAKYAETFYAQAGEWMEQNPYGRGANWNCAMEVAIRAINLLAAFDVFRYADALDDRRLLTILQLFDQHGRFIVDNNEFSYVATSNHYLSDVIGLFWIGTLMPELQRSSEWQALGLSEMLREMDKQVLPDGADFEASTGYHRFVTEMFLMTFLLARKNSVEIPQRYWDKLRSMLEYLNDITRPDGRMPLIGDADGSQIVTLIKRDADESSYLLSLGAAVFEHPGFKTSSSTTPEILWFFGEEGLDKVKSLQAIGHGPISSAFPTAGSYVMRSGDLYLHFNANDCGVNGRGSHAHNDALSIEVSAFGRPFIVDPGSYGYNLDRDMRHRFRSTAYHSTVSVDDEEQNSIEVGLPFIIGNEAKPQVLSWETNGDHDRVVAEHNGYMRLRQPVCHRRTVEFNKSEDYWVISDELDGKGEHELSFRFYIAPGLEVEIGNEPIVRIGDEQERHLYVRTVGIDAQPVTEPAFVSRNYGHRERSSILKWQVRTSLPFKARFILVPAGPDGAAEERLALIGRLTDNK
jgi:hypothetical protein